MSCGLDAVSIIIPAAPREPALERLLADLAVFPEAEIIVSREGTRAKSLNAGATRARRAFLWFLHADSAVSARHGLALAEALRTRPHALHYFDLAYEGGGLPALNAWGANWRSRLFGLPYGDQGLCFSADMWRALGGYPEDTPLGEDLLLVRRALAAQIALARIPLALPTSARKYHDKGWLRLTLLRQAQLLHLMRRSL
jgi:hypothetical protein